MEAKSTEIVVVYVTAPPEKAPELARALIERRLAACVNIIPGVRSIYSWEDDIQDDPEALMMIKTTSAGFALLRAAVVELHPYDVPEVICVPITEAHSPYQDWLVGAVAPRD